MFGKKHMYFKSKSLISLFFRQREFLEAMSPVSALLKKQIPKIGPVGAILSQNVNITILLHAKVRKKELIPYSLFSE